jgi:hypothetical protein
MGDYSSITCRDMFALGDVHGLHDVQLLQELRAARRSVQHLPVMVNDAVKVGKRHNSRCRYCGSSRRCGHYRQNSMQDLRRLTVAVFCALLAILQDVTGDVVTIATWNPNSSQAEGLAHMSAAMDALSDIRPDIACLQEVRNWDSVAELVSVLPNFQTLVVSRTRARNSPCRPRSRSGKRTASWPYRRLPDVPQATAAAIPHEKGGGD